MYFHLFKDNLNAYKTTQTIPSQVQPQMMQPDTQPLQHQQGQSYQPTDTNYPMAQPTFNQSQPTFNEHQLQSGQSQPSIVRNTGNYFLTGQSQRVVMESSVDSGISQLIPTVAKVGSGFTESKCIVIGSLPTNDHAAVNYLSTKERTNLNVL